MESHSQLTELTRCPEFHILKSGAGCKIDHKQYFKKMFLIFFYYDSFGFPYPILYF